MSDLDTERLQRAYPKIYLACHVRHVRAASTAFRLSSRDSAILVHLEAKNPVTPSQLADHLGVRASTLSAAIQKLEKLGYTRRTTARQDRRVIHLFLTPQGAQALAATSVLDARRVAAILRKLSPQERSRALHGVELLAQAAMHTISETRSRGR